ncbi:hypothetical protein RFI_16041 [Reticulomyxa filosa]|uniref:Uncharacterized protein n=1 Tax=Reticulomyxa filosa TaxID=46433 RepID=X6N5F0_RETFI|nr:hypothetical protein RFI_16041 [Reticulomyxa filosa]|eukprot:ETO21168.1 hypothetical protein RFI_16041 [Reticulomyxa filosa]
MEKYSSFFFFLEVHFESSDIEKNLFRINGQKSTITPTSEKQELGQKMIGVNCIGVALNDQTYKGKNEEISGNEQLQKKGVIIEDYFVTFQNENSKDNEEIRCCYLCHKNVFVGARSAGVANSGASILLPDIKLFLQTKTKMKLTLMIFTIIMMITIIL